MAVDPKLLDELKGKNGGGEKVPPVPPVPPKDENDEKDDNINYIEIINNLKKNTVPMEQYKQLQKEHKQVVEAYIKNKDIDLPGSDNIEPNETIEDLRRELYSGTNKLSNRVYIEKALKLRNAILEQTGKDPFLTRGEQGDMACLDRAQNVADGLQDMLDYADGDDDLFLKYYQKVVNDPVMLNKRR